MVEDGAHFKNYMQICEGRFDFARETNWGTGGGSSPVDGQVIQAAGRTYAGVRLTGSRRMVTIASS